MTIEHRLAAHIAGLRYEDLPEAALASVDRLFLDTLAAMFSGIANAECRGIIEKLTAVDSGVCSIIGRHQGATPGMAALANGIAAHWTEWDDVHDAAGIHGSAVIFPVLLAAAEAADLSAGPEAGRAFVTATVAAYDIAARLGRVMSTQSFHGWMPTGASVSIAAAGGAARLLGLDAAGILSAMGIAATGGGLSRQPLADRTSGKNALCGMAAKNAMDAALMAAAGIVGAPNYFAGEYGLNALHAGGKADLAPELDSLGRDFTITDAGMKPYPSCRSTHSSIDLMLDLLAERPDIGAEVSSVAFTVPDLPFALCGRPFTPGDNPRVSAQFSIPYTAALALTRGAIAPWDFLPETVLDFAADRDALIRNITVAAATPPIRNQATLPARARVTLRDGTVLDRETTTLKGSMRRPMTALEQHAKLAAATAGIFTDPDLARLQQAGQTLRQHGPALATEILRGV